MAQILETVTAQLRADAGQFVTGFNRSEQAVRKFASTAPSAVLVSGRLQNALANFAFQAAGVPGPLGKITESLLMFAGGSALTLGVVAGIGLIAKAYQALTSDAREAKKATDELIESQLKQRQEERGTGIRGAENLATLKAAIDRANERLTKAREEVATGPSGPDLTAALRREEEARKDLTNALLAYNRQLRELRGIETERDREERLKQEAKAMAEIVAEAETLTSQVREAAAAVRFDLIPAFEDLTADELKAIVESLKLPKIDMSGEKPGDLKSLTSDIRAELRKTVGDDKAQREIFNIGATVGDLLAQGVMGGFRDSASMMRSLFFAVLRFALGALSGGVLNGFSPGKSAAAAAEKLGAGAPILQGAMAGPELNIAIPAPMTPFDIARDAQWQRALRESLVVARSQGFKP